MKKLILFLVLSSVIFAGCNNGEDITGEEKKVIKTGDSENWHVDLIEKKGEIGGEIVVTPANNLNQIEDFSVNIDLGDSRLEYSKSELEKDSKINISISENELPLYKDNSFQLDIFWNDNEKEELILE
ncbi:hypothetical protein [Oceanobacillus kimchii]|uniref:hypothetical protein n=1 Tax=Oceanobacillus kimchii TaxID=746691 RepID=UPI000349B169|nr:hypothetical protein [Oceanobacillus kimchii]